MVFLSGLEPAAKGLKTAQKRPLAKTRFSLDSLPDLKEIRNCEFRISSGLWLEGLKPPSRGFFAFLGFALSKKMTGRNARNRPARRVSLPVWQDSDKKISESPPDFTGGRVIRTTQKRRASGRDNKQPRTLARFPLPRENPPRARRGGLLRSILVG